MENLHLKKNSLTSLWSPRIVSKSHMWLWRIRASRSFHVRIQSALSLWIHIYFHLAVSSSFVYYNDCETLCRTRVFTIKTFESKMRTYRNIFLPHRSKKCQGLIRLFHTFRILMFNIKRDGIYFKRTGEVFRGQTGQNWTGYSLPVRDRKRSCYFSVYV